METVNIKKEIVKGTRQEIKTWRILGSRKKVDRLRNVSKKSIKIVF